MSETGKYIYAIVNSNSGLDLKNNNDGSTGSFQNEYVIPFRDISVGVGNLEVNDFARMPKDVLAKFLINHQMVIERIMSSGYTVIPMKLGTFASDETEVLDILNRGYGLIKNILNSIENKIEIDIVVRWNDFNKVIKEVSEEKAIKDVKEKLSSGPVTKTDQMKVGIMITQALKIKNKEFSMEILDTLKNISQDFRIHELMDERMIVNAAFLINKTDIADFDTLVEELDCRFNEKLNFKTVAPLPPYSFYTLEVKKILFSQIEWAMKTIGLKRNQLTKKEVKKIYKEKVFSSHPDANSNVSNDRIEFVNLNRAYKIIGEYCNACEQAGQDSCLENEKELILVKVKK